MKVDLGEFVAFLQMKLKPAIPIDFVTKESVFAPFWYEYVTYLSSRIEEVNPEIADAHNALLYRLPTVAIVPRKDVFIVYVKKEEYDDIYLAYNTAVVSMSRGKHYYIVPFIEDKAIDVLIANKINPAILNETLYILPMLASIPCTHLLEEIPLLKDYLVVKMQCYLSSDDVAYIILGYVLLKLLSKKTQRTYEAILGQIKTMICNILEKRNIHIAEHKLTLTFMEYPIEVNIVVVKPAP